MAEMILRAIPKGTEARPCKYCGEPIYMAPTEKGRNMPLHVTEGERRHLKPTAAAAGVGEPHWGACPGANHARKPR